MPTKIEWTGETWNIEIGCSKISPGCKNCYAERMAKRLCGMGQQNYCQVVDRNGWTGKTLFIESALQKPFHWKKPRFIFVVSMGDLFHESVPFEWIDKVFTVIACNPHHTFLVLTKRPEIMKRWFEWRRPFWSDPAMGGPEAIRYSCWHNYGKKIEYEGFWPLKNVWLGVTAENQEMADERIPVLSQIPAIKRFVSIEQMLGPVDLTELPAINRFDTGFNALTGCTKNRIRGTSQDERNRQIGFEDTRKLLYWVICGGESGPGARPMHPDWARSIRDQCKEAGTPFFFKQWGAWVDEFHPLAVHGKHKISDQFVRIDPDGQDYKGVYMYNVGKKKAGHLLDGKEWRERP